MRATWAAAALVVSISASAWANGDNPECLGSSCGAPKEEGGGGGGPCTNGVCTAGTGTVWMAYTDDGLTLAYTDDADGDGTDDARDNCPFAGNRDQLDDDGDGVGNNCDNCAASANFAQFDVDGDGAGDACDTDRDGDGILNQVDNCPIVPNGLQANIDGDADGDVCDTDDDGDGLLDVVDLCPTISHVPNEVIADARCNVDSDRDGISDAFDNCLSGVNPSQLDTDADGIGDVCDNDLDNDGITNGADNCAAKMNRGQWDGDGDGLGDLCDAKFCVVVNSANKEDCLDPSSPFQVHAGGTLSLKRGQKLVLPIFANRNEATLDYTWTVAKRPAGSREAIKRPIGHATATLRFQYAYDAEPPTFTADVDGEYSLQLQATLTTPDRAYPDSKTSISALSMTATPENTPGAMGCSVLPDGSMAFALAMVAAAIARRRRQ